MKATFFVIPGFYLLPFLAVADVSVERQVQMTFVEREEISIEDLAQSFFYHYSGSKNVLEQIISPDGVNRIRPAIAAHQREMNDIPTLGLKLRRLCGELQGSRTGSAFAATLASNEQRDRNEQREAARRVLSRLDDDDKNILQDYLNTRFRAGFARMKMDYVAEFGSEPVPSERTAAITLRTCNAATQAEGMLEQ